MALVSWTMPLSLHLLGTSIACLMPYFPGSPLGLGSPVGCTLWVLEKYGVGSSAVGFIPSRKVPFLLIVQCL